MTKIRNALMHGYLGLLVATIVIWTTYWFITGVRSLWWSMGWWI